jgi:hypothetical protein
MLFPTPPAVSFFLHVSVPKMFCCFLLPHLLCLFPASENVEYSEQNQDEEPSWHQDHTSPKQRDDRYENQNEISSQDRYDEVCDDSYEEEVFVQEPEQPILIQARQIIQNNGNSSNSHKVVVFSEKRYNVINELMSTEKDYLENLEIVRDNFITPFNENKILAKDEMEIIFINWNDLVMCTNRLYKSLKIRRKMTMKQDVSIGDVLCENVISFPFFCIAVRQ